MYKDKLEILRQRIPIGIRHALKILEKIDGNVEEAEIIFRNELLTIIVDRTGVSHEVALIHLIKCKYDIPLTINSIDEERYSLTERIFRQYKNREEVLEKVASSIEEKGGLPRNYWLELDKINNIPQEAFCLVAVMEWIAYESYEDFEIALFFHLNIITNQIEKCLLLPDIADSLRKARERQDLIYRKYESNKGFENYTKARNILWKDKEFIRQQNYFVEKKQLLIDRLYEFVKTNIVKFS